MLRLLIPLMLLCCQPLILAQPISLSAGKMKGIKENGREIQHLEGNVRFEQSGNTVNCDYADYDVKKEELVGSGNVRILSTDGVTITGNSLVFNNKTKIARVEGGVRLTDKDMVLTTPWINYNTTSKIGWYGSGGKIVDSEMTLTSGTGSYNPSLKMLYFRKNVVLKHPDYKIFADTLQYNSSTGTSYFFSYTEIQSDSNTILCNYGEYNSKTGKSYFTKNAALISKDNIIRADTLSFNRNTGEGEAFGRLWVKDTAQGIVIYGNKGYYNKNIKFTRVTGNPLVRQYEKNGDSLMVLADTFEYEVDTGSQKRHLFAFHKVSLWRADFSGTSDSMVYLADDSLIKLFGNPVLWNETSRLNSDTMRIYMKQSRVSSMEMRGHSFVSIDEDSHRFSQISGNDMNNFFGPDNKIKTVEVMDHGKSVYYIKEGDSLITSANIVSCEQMKILFDSGKVDHVRFYGKPKGTIFPVDQIPEGEAKLVGFVWDIQNKPASQDFTPRFKVPGLPDKRSLVQGTLKRNP